LILLGIVILQLIQEQNSFTQGALFNDTHNLPAVHDQEKEPSSFDLFWSLYPNKIGKKRSQSIWRSQTKRAKDTEYYIYTALLNYLTDLHKQRRRGFFKSFKQGDTFLNQWEDWATPGNSQVQSIDNIRYDIEQVLVKLDAEEATVREVSLIKGINPSKFLRS
jgi:hypothetical protein